MQATGRQPQWAPDDPPLHYERHRPVQTTLYRLVQQHAARLIRFHGVLAPIAKLPALVVPQVPEAPAQTTQPAECEANCEHH